MGGRSGSLVVPCAISRALQSPGESAQDREVGTMQCCAFVTALCCVCVILRFLSAIVVPQCRFVLHPCSSSLGSEAQQAVTGAHGNCEIPNHKTSLRGCIFELW